MLVNQQLIHWVRAEGTMLQKGRDELPPHKVTPCSWCHYLASANIFRFVQLLMCVFLGGGGGVGQADCRVDLAAMVKSILRVNVRLRNFLPIWTFAMNLVKGIPLALTGGEILYLYNGLLPIHGSPLIAYLWIVLFIVTWHYLCLEITCVVNQFYINKMNADWLSFQHWKYGRIDVSLIKLRPFPVSVLWILTYI